MYKYIHCPIGVSALAVLFPAGPLYETEGRRGTGHLMEHLVCRTFSHMHDRLQMHGIEFNAITDDMGVLVYFRGLSAELDPMQKELVDALIGGIECVSEGDFENEKRTVLTEIRSCCEDQITVTELNALRRHFNYYTALGCADDVEKFTYEDMKAVYAERFTRPSKIISVGPTGMNFNSIKFAEDGEFEALKFNFQRFGYDGVSYVDDDFDNDFRTYMCVVKPIDKEDFPKFHLGMTMLTDGLNSPMETEIRVKRGLCYDFIVDWVSSFTEVIPVFGCYAPVENLDRINRIYDELLCNPTRFLTRDRFDICKKMLQVSRDTAKVMPFNNIEEIIDDSRISYYTGLDDITFEQVTETIETYLNDYKTVRIK